MISATKNLYINAYSGLTRRIWLLSAVMLINRSGTMVLAYMTLYMMHLGYTIEQGGMVVAIYGIGSVVGAYLGGKISDTIGFYYLQFSALLLGGILFIILGRMQSYSSICTLTFLLSMVNESFRPANSSAVAHYSTAQNRTQSFSLIRLAINLGWGVGSALGGFLATFNYQWLFWVDGITNIVAAFILIALLPRVKLEEQQKSVEQKPVKTATSPWRDKSFMYFIVFKILFAICFFQLFTTVPPYFKTVLKLNEFWVGMVMAVNGILIALFEMVIVYKLEGRRPYLMFMAYGAIMMAVSFLLLDLPVENGLVVAFSAMLAITIAEMISMPFMNSFYIARSTQYNRGQYAGLYTMGWSIAQVVGSRVGSLIAGRFGYFNLWINISIICIIAASGFFWLQRLMKNSGTH